MHIAIDYYLHSVEPQRRLSEVFYFVERARTHTPPPRFFFSALLLFACPRSQSSSPAEENSSIHFSLFLSLFFIFYFVHGPWSHTIRVYIRTSVYAMSRPHLVGRAETIFFFKFATAKTPASVVFRKGTRTSCRSPLFSASRSTILLSEARNISA